MDCYRKLKLSLSPNNKIYQDYESFDYKHARVPGNSYPMTNTFKQCRVPTEYFKNEPIYEVMKDLNLTANAFLIEASHCYNWHRDAWRNIAFNSMLNEDPNYYVAFAPEVPKDTHAAKMGSYIKAAAIRYDPNKFVLFNTQIPHITINTGTKHRYLLTIANYIGSSESLNSKPAVYDTYLKTVEYLALRNLLE